MITSNELSHLELIVSKTNKFKAYYKGKEILGVWLAPDKVDFARSFIKVAGQKDGVEVVDIEVSDIEVRSMVPVNWLKMDVHWFC